MCTPYSSRGRQNPDPVLEQRGTWDMTTLRFHANTGFCWASNITHASALSCLTGQHIVFVGDSTVRFQYLELVYFLHFGHWIPEWAKGVLGNPLDEETWGDWREYLIHSCNLFAPSERCDVFRYWGAPGQPHWRLSGTAGESRFYHNPRLNICVTFIMVWDVAQGHLPMGFRAEAPLSVETFKFRPYDWSGGYATVAKILKAEFGQVDAVFVNEGFLSTEPLVQGGEAAKAEMQEFEGLLKDPQRRRPVWMTSTESTHPDHPLVELAQEAAQLGWPILDRYAITMSGIRALQRAGMDKNIAYRDWVHLRSWMYVAFNEALLGMLCPKLQT